MVVQRHEFADLDPRVIQNNAKHLEVINITNPACEDDKYAKHIYQVKIVDDTGYLFEMENVTLMEVINSEKPIVYELQANYVLTQSESPKFTKEVHFNLFPKLNCYNQESEKLIQFIKESKEILVPPPDEPINQDLFKMSSHMFSESGEDMFLDQIIFKESVKNGFFIEAGATDFLFNSNTLHYEMTHDWRGLLVEVIPQFVEFGLRVRRSVWSVPYCLALINKPHLANISSPFSDSMRGVVPHSGDEAFETQCFPLYSLLRAVDNPTVNLFILDIEGAEFEVLKTIPWQSVDIEVMMIELEHAGKVFPGSREDVLDYLDENNYEHIGTMNKDDYFIRKDILGKKYSIDRKHIQSDFPEFKLSQTFEKSGHETQP